MFFRIRGTYAGDGSPVETTIEADDSITARLVSENRGIEIQSVTDENLDKHISSRVKKRDEPLSIPGPLLLIAALVVIGLLSVWVFWPRGNSGPSTPNDWARPVEVPSQSSGNASVTFGVAAMQDVRSINLLTGESEEWVKAQTWKAQELLKEKGVLESKEEILSAMLIAYPKTTKAVNYAECLAAYVTLRKKGHSKSIAVEELSALFSELGVP
jgi:hypothetical protein